MVSGLGKKTILITGGSGTLGSHIVREALGSGAQVLFTYFQNEKASDALVAAGARAYKLHLADREKIKSLKKKIKEDVAHIDVLINNAVTVRDKTIVNLSEDEWDTVLDVALGGTVFLTKTFLPLLYKSVQGKILNIVSHIGLHGAYGQANYAAAKGGLIAFTKSLARELGRKKILVNAINPGFMVSDITRDVPPMIRGDNKKKSCLGLYSDPQEAAQFILYLASDAVRTVSGQVFHFDSRIF